MALAQQYLDAIKKSEGFTPRASWDYKQNSNGYGTRARAPGEEIDQPEAERRFADEIGKARAVVDRFAPDADEGTKAALTSLTYNAGADWTQSGLGKAVQAGDLDTARQLFVQYNKAGGEILPGLANRRASEVAWIGNPQNASPESAGAVSIPPGSAPQAAPEAASAGNSVASASDPSGIVARLFGDGAEQPAPMQQDPQGDMLAGLMRDVATETPESPFVRVRRGRFDPSRLGSIIARRGTA